MTIVAVFKSSIYYEVEPILYADYMSVVWQKRQPNRTYTLYVGCGRSDCGKIAKILAEREGFISMQIDEDANNYLLWKDYPKVIRK